MTEKVTEKEHDVDYADPEEETKGTFEKKVMSHFYCHLSYKLG
jgi:hypothetical protein